MGRYSFSLSDITKLFQAEAPYLIFKGELNSDEASYKLVKQTNEFQIKDWFQKDWYALQDQFEVDLDAFNRFYEGQDFSEAKRKQFSHFKFNKASLTFKKVIPAMKEWGGLTHPPLKVLKAPLEKYDTRFRPVDNKQIDPTFFSPIFHQEIDDVSQSELSFNNEVHALADQAAYLKKKELIKNARETIYLSTLIFGCDQTGQELTHLLIKKHQAGVRVKVMIDGAISRLLKSRECPKKMREAGIEVIETTDFKKYKGFTIYHSKMLVVDGQEAMAGGMNYLDAEHLSKTTNFMNRDVDLYVKGPLVLDMTKGFLENWNHQVALTQKYLPLHQDLKGLMKKLDGQRLQGLRGQKMYQDILSEDSSAMRGVCRFINQAPYKNPHSIGQAYLKILEHTKNHLVITDPIKSDSRRDHFFDAIPIAALDKFDMFNLLHDSVQKLAKKGVAIDYITTHINMAGNEYVSVMNDKISQQVEEDKTFLANFSQFKLWSANQFYGRTHYKNLIKDWVPFDNVHVWANISFMHSKIFYFDRVMASVGSYNFHHTSTDQAYESTTICMDSHLNHELDKILVQDMANSVPLVSL